MLFFEEDDDIKDYIMKECKSKIIDIIYKEMDNISPRRKEYLILYLEGFSMASIAKKLKVDRNTVKQALFGGKKHKTGRIQLSTIDNLRKLIENREDVKMYLKCIEEYKNGGKKE